MEKLTAFLKECKKSDTNLLILLVRYCFYKLKGKKILVHQKTQIKGVQNIYTKSLFRIGISYIGFIHKNDFTLLNINGILNINGPFSIGRGCRLDIGKDATVNFGSNSYIHPFTKIIIMHGLDIGNNCSISWDCQIMDDDFHKIIYESRKDITNKKITISDNVWIGSQVSIYKGSFIGKGSVVASNSVVKGTFSEENVLIAGNPAKIIKREIKY